MKYKRNWAFEQMATVFFADGTEQQCLCLTNNKGQIAFLDVDGVPQPPEQFGLLGITDVHFMVPASLTVTVPDDVLARTYIRLGKTISEGDTTKKVNLRTSIEKELRKRGHNLHCLLSHVSE